MTNCKYFIVDKDKKKVEISLEDLQKKYRQKAILNLIKKLGQMPSKKYTEQEIAEVKKKFDRSTVDSETLKSIDRLSNEAKILLKKFNLLEALTDSGAMFSNRRLEASDVAAIANPNAITGLTPLEQLELEESLINTILSTIVLNKYGEVPVSELRAALEQGVEKSVLPLLSELEKLEKEISAASDLTLQPLLDIVLKKKEQLSTVIKEKQKLVSTDSENMGSIALTISAFLSTDLGERLMEEELDEKQLEENYSAKNFEKNYKATFSGRLLINLTGIASYKPGGREVKTNSFGQTVYTSPLSVMTKLLNITTKIGSSEQELLDALEEVGTTDKDMQQFREKYISSDEKTKNEFLYKMVRDSLSMKMVAYRKKEVITDYGGEKVKTNRYEVNVYEVVKRGARELIENWVENSKTLGLYTINGDNYTYDNKIFNYVYQNLLKFKKTPLEKRDEEYYLDVQGTLANIGIEVSLEVLQGELYQADISNFLGVLTRNVAQFATITPKVTEGEAIFKSINTSLKKIALIQSRYQNIDNSRVERVAGKMIQSTMSTTQLGVKAKKLKDVSYIKKLQQVPFYKNSVALQFLLESEEYRRNFEPSFTSLDFFKALDRKRSVESGITDLNKTDYTLAELGLLSARLMDNFTISTYGDTSFRLSESLVPSLSDKGSGVLVSIPFLNITKDLNIEEDVEEQSKIIRLNSQQMKYVKKQLFDSELLRIVQTYLIESNSKTTSSKNITDTEFYKTGAKIFNVVPGFNNLVSNQGVNIHTFIKSMIQHPVHKYSSVESIAEIISNNFHSVAYDYLDSYFEHKIAELIDPVTGSWVNLGIVSYDKGSKIKGVDKHFLKDKGVQGKDTIMLVALDYVVNNLVAKVNHMQVLMGDPAYYAKGSNKKIHLDAQGFVIEDKSNFNSSAEGLLDNLTKRAAMLIAPGNMLANSKGDTYLNIVVADKKMMSGTFEEIIKLNYGKSALTDKVLRDIDMALHPENYSKKDSDQAKKDLLEDFSDLAPFMSIEGTDAQEYTTWREHLDVLLRQGRLTSSEISLVEDAYKKLEAGEEISGEALKIVMQPIKPVYAGFNFLESVTEDGESQVEVEEISYVKSSSFPLLPQTTKGLKIDLIREKMEAIEKKGEIEGKKFKGVRMSYHTANKLGAPTNMYTLDELYSKEALDETRVKFMNREYFRVQQETPYKTGKNLKTGSPDMITQGSQMWKIIGATLQEFSQERIFPRQTSWDKTVLETLDIDSKQEFFTGEEVLKIKNFAEKRIIQINRDELLGELGLNTSDMATYSEKEQLSFIENLRDLLVKEVRERGGTDNNIEELTLKELNGVMTFDFPIWMTNNADKIESLLQGIITNRLINLKLPGTSHIVGSSEGFEIKGDSDIMGKSKQDKLNSLMQEYRNMEEKVLHLSIENSEDEGTEDKYKKVLRAISPRRGKNSKTPLDNILNTASVIRETTGRKGDINTSFHQRNGKLSVEALAEKIYSDNEGIFQSDSEVRDIIIEILMSPGTLKEMLESTKVELKLAELRLEEIVEEMEETENQTPFKGSDIVWFPGHEGKRLQATKTKDGKLEYAEVLVQSKFTRKIIDENGVEKTELVDLTKKPYSQRNEQGALVLNLASIDTNLLEQFSFRIPTSSLQSGAMLKVVGFLPESQGDLMIVPQEHTVQIGEDFDVDKRNVYRPYHQVDSHTGYIYEKNYDFKGIYKSIKGGDLEYVKTLLGEDFKNTQIEGDCFSKKAEFGARGNFTTGGKWELIKDLEGYPSHEKGGVDIKLGNGTISVGGRDIKAENGLLVPSRDTSTTLD